MLVSYDTVAFVIFSHYYCPYYYHLLSFLLKLLLLLLLLCSYTNHITNVSKARCPDRSMYNVCASFR